MSVLESVRRSLERGEALPAECYRDAAFFALERERVLRPGWHAVARHDQLPEVGDYASVDLCGEPLLMVRDETREFRVFSRVCRHRAHPVVEGRGNARRFVCPYHRWSYDLDGSLASAPLMKPDREQCGLPELRTERWQGFVLVNLDPDAAPLAAELGALDERLAPLDLAGLKTVGVLDFDSPWNWKVLVDNFMESYHHLGPHVESLQRTNPAKGTYSDDALEGPCSWLVNPGIAGAPDFYVLQVFPTLLAAVWEEMRAGAWYEMQIDRHDHFHLRIHMLLDPALAESPEAVEGLLKAANEVHLEDIGVCDAVQRGIQSRLWTPGPLSAQEGALTRFYRYLAERLAD